MLPSFFKEIEKPLCNDYSNVDKMFSIPFLCYNMTLRGHDEGLQYE